MIISISGMLGSGKSTVAKILAEKLNYNHYSSGDFMRELAKEKNISLAELSRLAEQNNSIDKEIDARQVEFGKKHDNFVIDGRLSWYFIPHSVKIYLDVKEKEAAQRIFSDSDEKRKNEGFTTLNDLVNKIKERKRSEIKRYTKYYGINHHDKDNYDIVIDTTNISAKDVAQRILDELKNVEYELSAGCVVAKINNEERKFLLIYQSKGKFWEFPKGHIEKNETELGAMKRELYEETGINSYELVKGFKEMNYYSYIHKKKIMLKKVTYFLVKSNDEIKLSKEHTKYKWAAIFEAKKLLKYPDMFEILKKADSAYKKFEDDKAFKWL